MSLQRLIEFPTSTMHGDRCAPAACGTVRVCVLCLYWHALTYERHIEVKIVDNVLFSLQYSIEWMLSRRS